MQNTNQRKEVLNHLQTKGSITSVEAIQNYGATRLSSIIFDLRKLGYNVITEMTDGYTRYGEHCQYATYRLKDGDTNDERTSRSTDL
jgi:hypothetical protein